MGQFLSHNLAELQAKPVPSQDLVLLIASLFFKPSLGTIQVLRHQRGGWVGSEKDNS